MLFICLLKVLLVDYPVAFNRVRLISSYIAIVDGSENGDMQ